MASRRPGGAGVAEGHPAPTEPQPAAAAVRRGAPLHPPAGVPADAARGDRYHRHGRGAPAAATPLGGLRRLARRLPVAVHPAALSGAAAAVPFYFMPVLRWPKESKQVNPRGFFSCSDPAQYRATKNYID